MACRLSTGAMCCCSGGVELCWSRAGGGDGHDVLVAVAIQRLCGRRRRTSDLRLRLERRAAKAMVEDEDLSCAMNGASSYIPRPSTLLLANIGPSELQTPLPAPYLRPRPSYLCLPLLEYNLLREHDHLLTRLTAMSTLYLDYSLNSVVTFPALVFAPQQPQTVPCHARYHATRFPLVLPRSSRSRSVPFCRADPR